MTRVLVLGAGGAAGINFCRSLRQAGGFHVIAADVDSRRVMLPDADEYRAICRANDADRPKAFSDLLLRTFPDVVYAQADKEVEFLSKRREFATTMLPSIDALGLASDKLRLNRHLESHGVAVPTSESWVDRVGIQFIDRMWIRAKCGAGSKAALPITSVRQAQNWVAYWCDSRGLHPTDFMLCEYLPGPEYAWQGVYRDGSLYASVARTRDEYVFAEQMPSGQSSTPSVATIVHSDQVNRLAEMAVKAIDPVPNGVYGVDCKTGADGIVKVTEINAGRFYTTSNFYAAAGCNLPALFVTLAGGYECDAPGRDPIPAGVTWVRSLDREPLLIPAA